MTRAGLTAFALAAAAAPAIADPDLRVAHAPAPRHLAMRPRAAAAGPAAPGPRRTAPAAPGDPRRTPAVMPAVSEDDPIVGIGGLRDPNQPVTAQLDLGYAIDGTESSPAGKSLSGRGVTPDSDYARIRSYGFGEAYVGTRGVGYTPLQTFFAARLELTAPAPATSVDAPPIAPPIADWFHATNLMIRSAWAELHGLSEAPWLAPLRARAGEFYVYGPWTTHLRGSFVAWDGKLVALEAYAGVRAPDYASADALSLAQAAVSGASARLDLRAWTHLPLAVTARILTIGATDSAPATEHVTLDVDYRPSRDWGFRAESRWLNGALANEHLQLRSRFRQVTNLVFDVLVRGASDWRWDPTLTQQDQAGEARRYLDLGPIVPQVIASARAGTVLRDNVDLLVRGAVSNELSHPAGLTAWSAPYVELAAAADVRLRRTVTLGASVLTRQATEKVSDLPPAVVDAAGAQPLVDPRRTGEQGFVEAGVSARMSLGARRFSATVEAFGRRTRYVDSYCAPDATALACATPAQSTAPLVADLRGGGRFTIDAWVNRHLRLFASYDVSTKLAREPEITGYKSLRLVVEGVY